MNLAYKYPIIFWNTACLIADSKGALEDEEEETANKKNKTTNYKKMAIAISTMLQAGIKVELPHINTSLSTFTPNVEENKIYYGLSAITNVGEDLVTRIIKNRPYCSPRDFYQKVKPDSQAMVALIKSGAFDSFMDRKLCMAWFLWKKCDKKSNLTLANIPGLIKRNLIPEDEQLAYCVKIFEFNRYLKAKTKENKKIDNNYYYLDERAATFLIDNQLDDYIEYIGDISICLKRRWNNYYDKEIVYLREWLNNNKESILKNLNDSIFKEDWEKYALGNYSAWEMESICFYYHEHELSHVNAGKYGISDFFKMPEEPIVADTFKGKGGREYNIYKLYKICGTCIAKDKNKETVSLLTPTGLVDIRFYKEHFALFDKQISEKRPDGTKRVIEKSWFNKGSKIMVQGYRRNDMFVPKKYKSSSLHQLYKIDSIDKRGDLVLRSERKLGEVEEDEAI